MVLSDDLVREPEGTLRALCAVLNLPFDPAMLAWPAGPKPYDGVWAPWWYKQTHQSIGGGLGSTQFVGTPLQKAAPLPCGLALALTATSNGLGRPCAGFEAPVLQRPRKPLPPHLRPLLAECWPMWELLRSHALGPLSGAVPRGVPLAALPGAHAAAAEGGGGASAGPADQPPHQAQQAKHGTHSYSPDPRNDDILIGIREGVTGACVSGWPCPATLALTCFK